MGNDTVTYTYNNRLRASMAIDSQPSTFNLSYSYDKALRLTNITSPAGTFYYASGGASSASPLVGKLSLPNGAYITNTYDNVARLIPTAPKEH